MPEAARPQLFTIPLHRAFADALAAGLIRRFGGDPMGLARGLVLVPTNRARRTLTEAFVRASGQGLLLPRLVAIGDAELDEAIGAALDPVDADDPVPPAIAPLDRRMILARLVSEARAAAGDPVDAAEAVRLAGDLARTLDQLLVEEVDPRALGRIELYEPLNRHWEAALQQFAVVIDRWPRELAARGKIDLATRRARLLDGLARRWRATPPPGFVCAAGITTAAPAIARLLRVVADLPNGMVVLPGLATAMDEAEWQALGPHDPDPATGQRRRSIETHPQFQLKLLLDRMGLNRAEAEIWRDAAGPEAPPTRGTAVLNAMAPAEFTGKWTSLPAEERRLGKVRAVELATPAAEAQAIALALREALDVPGRTAALVTPDRALARRVAAHCARWGIEVDDSAGEPLSARAPGTLLIELAEAAAQRFAPMPLLALLKHPLVRAGEERLAWLEGARALDLALRGPRPAPGLAGIDAHLAAPGREAAAIWWPAARALLEPLAAAFEAGSQPLSALIAVLRETASALGGDAPWQGPAGRAAADLLADLEAGEGAPAAVDPRVLPALLRTLMDEIAVRPPQGGHPRIAIYGLIEARLQNANLMILAGLNEGVWPGRPAPDPWLAPRIRAELGLAGLDRRVGLAAHDFATALGAPEVLLTRARRDATAPTIASRFWLRLEAMLDRGLARADDYADWAQAIDRPEAIEPASRPAPVPPAKLRPTRISVTDVDRLKADPFAFYARQILNLRPLDAIDADPGPAWRGSAVHDILEAWAKADDCDPAALLGRAEALLAGNAIHPLLRALWQPRLIEAIEWIAKEVAVDAAAGRRVAAVERKGKAEFAGIDLDGRADRIDRLANGALAIVDYKTGKPPSPAMVREGFSLQLGLLGLIIERGGFADLGKAVGAFEYWSLAKGKSGFGYRTSPVDPDGAGGRLPTADFTAHAAAQFADAAARWLTGDEAFTAKLVPEYAPYGDYDRPMRGGASPPAALPRLLGQQAQASEPDRHVWLSASAGTGKTQVLAARVYRLLLGGIDPAAILCLTFTKAGAAEMAGRINQRLAAWVRMPEPELRKDLYALGEDWQRPGVIARARTLFARVLDAPGGGIRIQTIHSFCQALLASFPAEAGLVPGFRPIEPREEARLARDALAELLVDAEREGRSSTIAAIAALSKRSGEQAAEAFLLACARAPDAMAALPSGVAPFLRGAVGLPQGDVEALIAEACSDAAFDSDPIVALAAANRAWGTATGLKAADTADAWLAASPGERAERLDDLAGLVLTKDGKPRSVSAKLLAIEPDYELIAEALITAIEALRDQRRRAAFIDFIAPILAVGRDYAAVYARAKRRIGAVDFDDLIRATVRLLAEDGMGEWVRYKLDQATDHILVDEAQDTNRDQWDIIDRLTEEFFAGEGARDGKTRTLFVVGDFKQAIFGFQGTSPLHFARAGLNFEDRALAGRDDEQGLGTRFERLSLTHSFRSTRPILDFVDAALAVIPPPGLGPVDATEAHASEVKGPGIVTLWPPEIGGDSEAEEEGWVDDATRALARRIARQVRDWLDPAHPLMLESAGKGRPLRPEDVMILVKRRGELASLIVARLYAENVPVAGIDRLRLNTPLGVQDLLAAIRFVLQPDDDLTLASLLVSPLLGWSQDDLMAAAVPRGRVSLWRHLRASQPAERLAALAAMLARADFTTPYRFLEELLSGALNGRRKLLARIGEEARDPIDELLGAALQFESLATPSLQGFLDWFDRGEVEIKRDPSAPLDAVRVMTAHGAKGLQAPLVILADATVDPERSPRSILRWSPDAAMPGLPIPRPTKAERVEPFTSLIEEADARELEEHWRLFYVAATRAEERLVIAGALGPMAKGEPPALSWYAAARRAFDAMGVVAGEGPREFHGHVRQEPVKPPAKVAEPRRPAAILPDWARLPAPVEARPPRPLAPSSLGADDVADPPPGPTLRVAARRGQLIHALFERLPGVAADQRRAAADRWLAGAQNVSDPTERTALIDAALGVIDAPDFAELFGPDALAETPIAAVVEGGHVVAGTVDRLLVTPDRVRLIDFKTGRRAPASLDDVPIAHLRQMAAYAAALGVIFPDRPVEAALLYTAGPTLFDLPADLLRAHKPRFGADQQSLGLPG